jgi:dipeptidyl aminopeptidase/acylaminoacyl peptidase
VADDSASHALVFTHWDDQRVYRLDAPGGEPRPLTPAPPEPSGWRYVDPVPAPGGTHLWWVREAHADGPITRHIVAVPLDGSAADDPSAVREVVGGSHFLAGARPSPDGRRLAWLAWDHPQMPWDGTELRVADLGDDGIAGPHRTVLGGPTEAVFQPEWADDDTLYAVSDRTGWWNLYRLPVAGGDPEPLCPREEEFGVPLWTPGMATYAVLSDGRVAVLHGRGQLRLGVLDPRTGELRDLDLPYRVLVPLLRGSGNTVALTAGGPRTPATVLRVDTGTGEATEVHVATDPAELPDAAYLPEPTDETLPGPGGRDVHALVYPPTNPAAEAPEGELPPYVVFVHGGPTAHTLPSLDLQKAYFTSRGIGVVDVNYGGSTGYGREYRERLREQWGVVDVEDCVAAAQQLGASYYGVAELLRFAQDTHDFESRYLDGLIGPLPETYGRYVDRAPLSHVDQLSCPVLLLQGLEDEVVPPSQAELFRDALAEKGIPHAYLAFPGEQHGFRRAETVITALEAELSFYGQVLGFDPPGVPQLELSTG